MSKAIRSSSTVPHWIVRRVDAAGTLPALARLLVPHAVILGLAFASISRMLARPECVGFCALYAGSVTYAVLLAAIVLSSLVAAGQLLLFRG